MILTYRYGITHSLSIATKVADILTSFEMQEDKSEVEQIVSSSQVHDLRNRIDQLQIELSKRNDEIAQLRAGREASINAAVQASKKVGIVCVRHFLLFQTPTISFPQEPSSSSNVVGDPKLLIEERELR